MPERKIPTTNEVNQWLRSQEGQSTCQLIHAIREYQHDRGKIPLSRFVPKPLIDRLPDNSEFKTKVTDQVKLTDAKLIGVIQQLYPDRLLRKIESYLPITNITNTMFMPEIDILLQSRTTSCLAHPSFELGSKFDFWEDRNQWISHVLQGMTYRVKSNGWEVFDAVGNTPNCFKCSISPLVAKGFTLLRREYRQKTVSVTPAALE